MRGVNFYGTNLCYAKFKGADLSKADCRNSDLTGADFGEAVLNRARFKGAKVLDVDVKEIHSAKGTLFADLRGLSSKQTHEQEVKDKITECQQHFKLSDLYSTRVVRFLPEFLSGGTGRGEVSKCQGS
jgi:uncharacterized protein YjbI with pentapeptide repeats